MGRKRAHEEHVNHEAWAIPYGDLITLLLAFFVVMYAISSVNEGKYRVLADALSEAFGGPPRTINPLQLGKVQPRGSQADRAPPMAPTTGARGAVSPMPLRDWPNRPQIPRQMPQRGLSQAEQEAFERHQQRQLDSVTTRIEEALAPLIDRQLVRVRRARFWVEVEISTDLLFASGQAYPAPEAQATLRQLADILRRFPNPLRVEGHTDDRPISNLVFPSNWELSAARAAAVVRLFAERGVPTDRLSVVGYGPFRPARDNADEEGRAANRRVVVVVLTEPGPYGDIPTTAMGAP